MRKGVRKLTRSAVFRGIWGEQSDRRPVSDGARGGKAFLTVNAPDGMGEPEGFSYPREIQPILDRHCIKCHTG
jgi:hypothetical protein